MTFCRSVAAAIALILCAGTAHARPATGRDAHQVALTFDDLPALTDSHSQAYVDDLTRRLLATLRRRHVPAIGFVNQGKLGELDRRRQTADLQAWLRAGMDLGNHGFSHESPNAVGAKAYVQDIARGEPVTRRLLARYHRRLRWYRHPYLETGSPASARHQIDAWLSAHHYRVAPVTMENSDWAFAEAYDDVVAKGDAAGQARLRAEYLQFSDRVITWYQKSSRALFGREIAFVMLLHATRLHADCLPDLLAILAKHGLRPVSIATAMSDPAYRTPDHYVGKDGIEWLERWSQTLKRDLPWNDVPPLPKEVQAVVDRDTG